MGRTGSALLSVCVAATACAGGRDQSRSAKDDVGDVQSATAAPETGAPSAGPSPSFAPAIALRSGQVLRVMVDDLAMRDAPSATAVAVDALHAGESVAAVDGQPIAADGLTWYEVRQGPGPSAGWVTSGPERTWLRVVGNGRIAFTCTTCVPAPGGGGTDATFTIEPDGSDLQTLLEHAAVLTWSPDGTRIAVVLTGTGSSRLVLMDLGGSDGDDIGSGIELAWSPDGSQLAYVDETGQLILLDAAGSASLLAQGGTTPAWAPDGSQLAFGARSCAGCEAPLDQLIGVFVVDLSERTIELLVESAYDPRWAPDGETIAVSRLTQEGESFGGHGISQVPSGGGDPAPTSGVPGQAALNGFAWSPDGSSVAFGDVDGIYVANADGSDRRLVAVSDDVLAARNPRWSPDGRSILYDMAATQGDAIFSWVVGRDGSDPHQLGEAASYDADWQPLLTPLP